MSGLRLLKGALAGCIATGPMTVAMLLMHRLLPGEQRYALPPTLITRRLTGGKGPFARFGSHASKPLTYLMHFGFGTTFGAVFALLPRQLPLPAPLRGILFALCVWAGSYLGWIPAAQILSPATKHPAGRNILMIVAHIVWGAGLALLLERLDPANTQAQGHHPDHSDHPDDTEEASHHATAARPAAATGPAESAEGAAAAPTAAAAPEPAAGDRVGDDAPPGGGGPGLPGERQAQG
jgi:hypothetical protein